jgi:hypothetical protein
MSATTAEELLNDKPSDSEVERVDALWSRFNSTTQFLNALKQVLIERDLPNEVVSLEKFLLVLAQVEATDMNVPLSNPITQR